MIRVSGLTKRFGRTPVLNGIDATIARGECVAIIGPSGTGKSVFLRCLALLEKPDSGSVIINGTDITARGADINRIRERMGLVAQGFNLFSHLTVLDNITLAPRFVRGQAKADAEARAHELLALVGLAEKAHAWPTELSGGQQQRIAIARCLAMDPDIILFDEPTSALDPLMTREVLTIMRKLTDRGLTLVVVTHEMDFARDSASRIFYFDEGTLYEEGTPAELLENPKRDKTRAFVRSVETLQFAIGTRQFDLVAMNARIDWFCRMHGLNQRQAYRIQLVVEELILEILESCFPGRDPDLKVTVDHSQASNGIVLGVTYSGAEFNPLSDRPGDGDQLGMTLVTGIARSHGFSFTNGINSLIIKL
jgi:polar amino acid transport system ATP-binding protein